MPLTQQTYILQKTLSFIYYVLSALISALLLCILCWLFQSELYLNKSDFNDIGLILFIGFFISMPFFIFMVVIHLGMYFVQSYKSNAPDYLKLTYNNKKAYLTPMVIYVIQVTLVYLTLFNSQLDSMTDYIFG